MTFQPLVLTPEERVHQESLSEEHCACCGKQLTNGEADAAGICTACYFEAVGDSK